MLSSVLSDTFILLSSSSAPMHAWVRVCACAQVYACVRASARACMRAGIPIRPDHNFQFHLQSITGNFPLFKKCLSPKPPRIFPLTNNVMHIDVFNIYFSIVDPITPPPPNVPLIFFKSKTTRKCPTAHSWINILHFLSRSWHFPRFVTFGMLTPRNPKMPKKNI